MQIYIKYINNQSQALTVNILPFGLFMYGSNLLEANDLIVHVLLLSAVICTEGEAFKIKQQMSKNKHAESGDANLPNMKHRRVSNRLTE